MSVHLEKLADRLWSLDTNDGIEASMALRQLAKLQDLHDRSLCTRVRKLFGRVANRIHGVRS